MTDLENEQIVFEIRGLVNRIDNVKEEINIYCDLMKQIFLAGSAQN